MLRVAEESDQTDLIRENIPQLREQWLSSQADILCGPPLKIPPLQEVNHCILLIDENKWYSYHMPTCPEILRQQLITKME
jgi:hypothetical protein